MQIVDRCIDSVCRMLNFAIAALLAVMVILVFGNVVARYGFNSGITISEELSRWMFIWMTFLGAVVALRERGHLGMDMFVSRLSRTGKKCCLVLGQLLMLYIVGLVLIGSWEQAVINADVKAPVSGAPMAIVYASGVVFAVLSGLILLVDLYRTVTGRLREDDLIMIQESEDAGQLRQLLQEHGQAGQGGKP
ncbi:TRAP transporter small permease [Bordetella hinzii]|uniref:TRAP transporter small permease protein n=2 Tax=Bordetella hinzii TaxID=103855 RepID=A0AAN1RU00_9BORD|nr:TRAP transporter small permease [Bordetella hinzii]AKQ54223.1 2,3-diketo-L-gulonate TRAP transporter small permease protein YiaM [Bordetella hinzii]AKQ58737.1 2,3-diketo-L-gulonate TRAP transporter small permease protein YiaM [Bordetella hinzii]AZW15979.1 TRAP transporter small permease [Bordetella hinzii]KCB26067.1 TRAP transporter, DctQ-like membrane protein [Bordetella hinzii OH87 BAL007II]KCB28930.1 TRAP transporter, DctQ-like membrane protein [Bordetella hinzii L60]